MLALLVDDETALLNELKRAVTASPDIEEAVVFTNCADALTWAEVNTPDIAFLDIKLRGGCTGLDLSEKLRKLHPDLKVILCTGYSEFALDAYKLHINGYLIKPVTHEAVQKEIDVIKAAAPQKSKSKVTVQCFGNFEVFVNGTPLRFKRKRSKEVLAYLIDRKGASVSTKEICAVLWEDDFDTEKNLAHLYKLMGDLRQTLAEAGIEDLIIKNGYDYAVNTEITDCDYYNYLSGKTDLKNRFGGEYMIQYSWAEETTAALYEIRT